MCLRVSIACQDTMTKSMGRFVSSDFSLVALPLRSGRNLEAGTKA